MTAREDQTQTQSNTRTALLEAAVDMFARQGYHATSVRDLTQAVSIRAATMYHWFPSKESILMELQRAFIADLAEVVEAAVNAQQTPEARMAAAVRGHVAFHGRYSREAFATDSEIRALSDQNRAEIVALRDAYQDRFIKLIDAGVSSGVFRVADVRITSYAVLLQCTGVAMWFKPDGPRSLDEVGEIHAELVLESLGADRDVIASALTATRPAAQSQGMAVPSRLRFP